MHSVSPENLKIEYIYQCFIIFFFSHPMTMRDQSSQSVGKQVRTVEQFQDFWRSVESGEMILLTSLMYHNSRKDRSNFLLLLKVGKRSLPIIPGISTKPGSMIFAGSIGTQIANELLDFNRCGLTTEHVLVSVTELYNWHLCTATVVVAINLSLFCFRMNSSPSSGNVSPFSLPQDKSPQTLNQLSNNVSFCTCILLWLHTSQSFKRRQSPQLRGVPI